MGDVVVKYDRYSRAHVIHREKLFQYVHVSKLLVCMLESFFTVIVGMTDITLLINTERP